jgi:hypothetical protein
LAGFQRALRVIQRGVGFDSLGAIVVGGFDQYRVGLGYGAQ